MNLDKITHFFQEVIDNPLSRKKKNQKAKTVKICTVK